jgi:hypothetical protein
MLGLQGARLCAPEDAAAFAAAGRALCGHDRSFLPPQSTHELLIQVQVSIDELRRCQCQPLIERYVGEVAALEYFQKA